MAASVHPVHSAKCPAGPVTPDLLFSASLHAGVGDTHHSSALRVTERYTKVSEGLIQYEATLEDPSVYARPWQIRMPLYRRVEDNARLLEFKCVPFAEQLLYGR